MKKTDPGPHQIKKPDQRLQKSKTPHPSEKSWIWIPIMVWIRNIV
jgi:hypothetical protein